LKDAGLVCEFAKMLFPHVGKATSFPFRNKKEITKIFFRSICFSPCGNMGKVRKTLMPSGFSDRCRRLFSDGKACGKEDAICVKLFGRSFLWIFLKKHPVEKRKM
jgi:hypothetical protein